MIHNIRAYFAVKYTHSRILLSLMWVMWASRSPWVGSTLNVSVAHVSDLDSEIIITVQISAMISI